MESTPSSGSKITGYSKALMVAFAIALLISIYLVFTLPSDLRFKGNLQYLDLVAPILTKLYIALGLTAVLAVLSIYAEMKNVKIAVVYKEKSAAQVAEEKSQSETNLESLDSTSVAGSNSSDLLSASLNTITRRFNGVAGACYISKEENGTRFIELVNGFALPLSENDTIRFNFGEGMVGQVAKSGTPIYIDEIPEGYFQVVSGLGQSSPRFILILPLKKNNDVKGIIEVATFNSITAQEKQMAEKFANEIGGRLN